ncbi:hypothetical protein TanjilG_03577 [Lupinus angustifolius]|uniref:BHLH domain-containing protein n=1 Tax=Lupinus angustifolius TaxID=3871 RepID=A0A394DE71_LUPAN|nr:PREDICTED: transcription factor UPBEAT1-like [Lupinus angustifolius]OIW21445.1 hypothetical protein TanjilG_03577 [Lupinus angustifolius]
MGISSQPFLVSLSLKSSSYEWSKVLVAQAKKQKVTKKSFKGRMRRRILMKRKTLTIEGSRKQASGIQRRVRALKKLIPNNKSIGLEGLYIETAQYILSLQMKVKAMQFMVNTLTGFDE